MNFSTIYKIGFLAMISLNLVLIGILVFAGPPGRPGKGGPEGRLQMIISEKLDLSEAQQNDYFRMADLHRESMNRLDEKQRDLLKKYFETLKQKSGSKPQKEALEKQIREAEGEKAAATYRHFEELKNICTDSQTVVFEELMNDIIEVMLPGSRKPNNDQRPR